MISVEEFTTQLTAEFEDVDPHSVFPSTNYRDIKNWSSMYALIIIAFKTIKSLYDIV